MSFLTSRPIFDHSHFVPDRSEPSVEGQPLKTAQAADRAIDSALRSVPLPAGLMTRLGKLVYTMPDETADPVDWLGC